MSMFTKRLKEWFSSRTVKIHRSAKRSTELACERLESRWVPVSKPIGDYAGTVTENWEFDQPGLYRITGNLVVPNGVTLTVGTSAGVDLLINNDVTITVEGTLKVDGANSFKINDSGFNSEGIAVNGTMKVSNTNLTINGTNSSSSTSFVQVNSGGRLQADNSSFAWDVLAYKNNSVIQNGDVTQSSVQSKLFLPMGHIPLLGGNKSFGPITITSGGSFTGSLNLGKIGSENTTQSYTVSPLLEYGSGSTGKLTIPSGSTVTIDNTSKVLLSNGAQLDVQGALNLNAVNDFRFQDASVSPFSDTVIFVNGSVSVTETKIRRENDANSSQETSIRISSSGTFKATNSEFSIDRVVWFNGVTVGGNDIVGSSFVSDVWLPMNVIPQITNNVQFGSVVINGGGTVPSSITLSKLGTSSTNQRYIFTPFINPYTSTTSKTIIPSGSTVTIDNTSKVLLSNGAQLDVQGALNLNAVNDFRFQDASVSPFSDTVIFVNGSVSVTETKIRRENDANSSQETSIRISSSGTFKATNSEFSIDRVVWFNGVTVGGNDIVGSSFVSDVWLPMNVIPQITNNVQFGSVVINGGGTVPSSITLSKLGTSSTNQRYIFTPFINPYTSTTSKTIIPSGSTVTIDNTSKVLLSNGAQLDVQGALNLNAVNDFRFQDASVSPFSDTVIFVNGSVSVTETKIRRENDANSSQETSIRISSSGTFKATNSEFSIDRVVWFNGVTVGGNDIVGSSFVSDVWLPMNVIPQITNNVQFGSVVINGGGTVPSSITLSKLGTSSTNQRYIFTPFINPYTSTTSKTIIPSGSTVTIDNTSKVLLSNGAQLDVQGALNLNAVNDFRFQDASVSPFSDTVIFVNGSVSVTETKIRRENDANSSQETSIRISSSGKMEMIGGQVDIDSVRVDAGGQLTLRYLQLGSASQLRLNSSAIINIADNDFAPVGTKNIQATGTKTIPISLGANFWGTGATTSDIENKLLDQQDDVNLPDITFATPLPARPVRPEGVEATKVYSTSDQSVPLSAVFTSPSGIVNQGQATFSVIDSVTFVTIGSSLSASVVNGAASVTYLIPGSTPGGKYIIQIVYNDPANFFNNLTDKSKFLTLEAAPASGSGSGSGSYTFVGSNVNLSASFSSSAGVVNGGIVTFSVYNGMTLIGTKQSTTVSTGSATVSYPLGVGLNTGSYSVEIAYAGTSNFKGFTDKTGQLTIGKATGSITSADTSASYLVGTSTVTVSATVGSSAGSGGSVNSGSVTFGIYNGSTLIGSSQTVAVNNGAASASYGLPAGLTVGSYTLKAEYSGAGNFTAAVAGDKTLTITKAAAMTTAQPASATFKTTAQQVPLSATVTSTAGIVGEGKVEFVILDGSTNPVGSSVVVPVVGGNAAKLFDVPAGLAAGKYTIQAKFYDAVNFLTFTDTDFLTISPASVTIAANNASIGYSGSSQNVALSATVTSSAGIVSSGSVTFTILSGSVTIGSPVTVNVVGGSASGSFTLPAGTAGGTYSLSAAYSGATNFTNGTDSSKTLLVTPATATITAESASVGYLVGSSSVTASASLVSAAGIVNAGTVTFTILHGSAPLGTANATVVGGKAATSLGLPTGLGVGNYTIQAVYNGSSSFLADTADPQTLTVTQASAAIAAQSLSVGFLPTAQTITLTATISSAAGSLNQGQAVFTILSGSTVIGSPVTVGVTSGAASANYTLPAGLPIGTYTIATEYLGTANVGNALGDSKSLTVTPAVVTVSTSAQTIPFSNVAQTVLLSAQVNSPAGIVDQGTLTFTILGSSSTVTAEVRNGTAFASYSIPAGVPSGSYTIQATYNGSNGFQSGSATNTLTINPVPPTVPPNVPPIGPPTVPPVGPPTVPPISGPSGRPTQLVGFPQFAIGSGPGGSGVINVYGSDGSPIQAINAFPGFGGGVRTAIGDFNGDGVSDFVAATGPGGIAEVQIFDGTNSRLLFRVQPFETFTGGVYVAVGDFNGDGLSDVAISPDEGGGPRVRIFRGGDFVQLADFFGIEDPAFRGGARVSIADITGDGTGDLMVAAGFGGGPRLAVFDGRTLRADQTPQKPFGDFFVFEPTLRNGVFVTGGDLDGDGFADIIAGGGPGGGPRVYAVSGREMFRNRREVPVANFFAGNVESRGGIRVAVKDLDGDAKADLVVGSGTGAGSQVTAYLGRSLGSDNPPIAYTFDGFPGFANGIFVG